jgi:hypothetical protein
MREHIEERKSVGSRLTAAKPRVRWRAPSAQAGRGALVDGRRLGSGKPPALTRGRWKRFWLFAEAWQQVKAGRDRGRQRPVRRLCARLTTPRQRSAALERGSSPLHLMRGTQAGRPKLVQRRQTLIHLGSDCRKAVRRRNPDGIGAHAPAHRGGGLRGASCGLGSRAIFGCSFRTSVAEVGATHLPGESKVSREASQGGAG